MFKPSLPRWAYVVLAALAVAIAGFGYVSVAGPRVDVIEAKPMTLRQTVVVSGRVLTPATVEIGATITGRVGRIHVDEGRHVADGDVLIELEHDELAAALKTAEAQEAAARNRIVQWRETGLPGMQQTLVQAEENYRVQQRAAERSAQLFAQGFIGQASLDEARRAETVAKSQLETAKANFASVQQTGAEYRLLDDQLRAAVATPRNGGGEARANDNTRAGRRHRADAQRRAGRHRPAGEAAADARPRRRHALDGAGRRKEPRGAARRATRYGLRGRISDGSVRGRARVCLAGRRRAARHRRDQVPRAEAARVPARRHDGLDRGGGRRPRQCDRRAAVRRARSGGRIAVGAGRARWNCRKAGGADRRAHRGCRRDRRRGRCRSADRRGRRRRAGQARAPHGM